MLECAFYYGNCGLGYGGFLRLLLDSLLALLCLHALHDDGATCSTMPSCSTMASCSTMSSCGCSGGLTFRLMLYYVFMQVQWGLLAQLGAIRMFYYIFMRVQWGLAFCLRALLCPRALRLLHYLFEQVQLGIRYRNPWELGSSLGLLHLS